VLATENSLPQFRKTPQVFSLARVELTLLTTLILYNPFSSASLNGISKSIVSPLYEILKNPPFCFGKSLFLISLAIIDCTYLKQPKSFMIHSPYFPAKCEVPQAAIII